MLTDNFFEVIINSTISFFSLLIITRILGKKQMSQLTFFNYVTGITIGSIAANLVDLKWEQFRVSIFGLIIWAGLTVLISVVSMKSSLLGDIFHGEPTIVIKYGKIEYHKLSKLKIDIDSLMMMLREKDVFMIKEVMYAILETNGKLTVFKYPEYASITKQDMKLEVKPIKYLPTDLVIDGKIAKKNLKELGLTEKWLKDQLKINNVKDVKDLVYVQLQTDGTIHIDRKTK